MGYKEGVHRDLPHGSRIDSSFYSNFDSRDWEGHGRYKKVLDMARRDACYEEVRDMYPDVTEDLYEEYRRIVAGTTANFSKNGPQEAMNSRAMRKIYMLELSTQGLTPQEIADRVNCSVRTVREALFGLNKTR